jgi:hypothetical protein
VSRRDWTLVVLLVLTALVSALAGHEEACLHVRRAGAPF